MNLQEEAKQIFFEVGKACDIRSLIRSQIRLSDGKLYIDGEGLLLSDYSDILLIGIGKASVEMGFALEEMLADRINQGILVTPRCRLKNLKSEVIIAGHPLPNELSLKAALKILKAIRSSSEKALVLFMISGGGSSLVELPQVPITFEDIKEINRHLVNSGATIFEINRVRKYFSQIKGGKLGLELGQRKCIAIYLSDVNFGDLSSIASGPLFYEEIDKLEVLQIFEKFNLIANIPASVYQVVHQEISDPGRNNSGAPGCCKHLLLADNNLALDKAAKIASEKGFQVMVKADLVEGDYRAIADESIRNLLKLVKRYPDKKVCLISGGEVSCSVKGKGIGGRNQEFVVYSASKLTEYNNDFECAILSVGTDGVDGVSVASGAVMPRHKLSQDEGIFLADNDSHSLIKSYGGLMVLGPTGNNIRDLRLHLASPIGPI